MRVSKKSKNGKNKRIGKHLSRLFAVALSLLLVGGIPLKGEAAGPGVSSESAVVMDIDSGAILYAKNMDTKHYPASITKVMTALVALEHYELSDMIGFTWDDVGFLEYNDAHIGLTPGEEITFEHAMYGMLLASANEVSHAIGRNVEGGYEAFLQMMNEKAAELGCKNSHFMNTHGLHDEEHYVSAYDMALIGAAAFQHEFFRTVIASLQHSIPETNLVNEKRVFQQNHKMVFDWRTEYYEYCVGGKTGYTPQAQTTLVTFAQKDGVNLVAVVLKADGGSKAYKDTKALLEYGFNSFSKTIVSADMVEVKGLKSIQEDAYVMLSEGITFDQLAADIQYPTEFEDKTGTIVYTHDGWVVGKVEFTITDAYYNELHGIKEPEEKKPSQKKDSPAMDILLIVVKVILWLIFIVVILYLLLVCYAIYKRKQKRKRKAELRRQRREQEYRRYVRQMQDDEE